MLELNGGCSRGTVTYKADMMNSMFKLLRQSLLATGSIEVLKVKSYKLRPRKVRFRFWWMNIGLEVGKVILREIFLNC